jgi:hypothetical protein
MEKHLPVILQDFNRKIYIFLVKKSCSNLARF